MTTSENAYGVFLEKVKRTVYIDNLSPQVTEAVLKASLNQFGDVENVEFIPNYTFPSELPRCALVEMKTSRQAQKIMGDLSDFPFLISGMPRPVRVRKAEVEMFDDRPEKPGSKVECSWLTPEDPNFQVAIKLKKLSKQHVAETAFLLKHQLEEEKKLASQQWETLKANYKKFEMIDSVINDGTSRLLSERYNIQPFGC
ncbi:uncharacterized protein LOC124916752 [Impatiens glandulifera]|uniref:uncharacterized protein LOC124916752 n=1 Tax=Impatiens glandulifera TaxID=253017 RepID=UPI001FB0863F|nr:uncharacterized protein LOC124916752 [Impatiens glandulifera]XP_047313468.1 uncharacterized protein LOC124916752 [Impatiens glandulifera]XP_047313469.1 uncharacterized protein LOC124916752 [Impatiens glandulifera]